MNNSKCLQMQVANVKCDIKMLSSFYPDKQIVLMVCDEGKPYSKAKSFSLSVAVNRRTGGHGGLGAENVS